LLGAVGSAAVKPVICEILIFVEFVLEN